MIVAEATISDTNGGGLGAVSSNRASLSRFELAVRFTIFSEMAPETTGIGCGKGIVLGTSAIGSVFLTTLNEKSPSKLPSIHGSCIPFESRFTPAMTLFSISSIGIFGVSRFLSRCVV